MKAGVIGYPLKHSISPQFQQPAFDALGLDVTYRACEIAPPDVPQFIAGLRAGDWLGCNVTIPHKKAVYDLMDSLTEEARLIGAVNTVIYTGGALTGHNTDATGFLRALVDEAGFDVAGKRTVVLGAGGAARAAAVALLRAGAAAVALANRTVERAEALAKDLAVHFERERVAALPLETDALRGPLAGATLLVNSTSVGMAHGPAPDAAPVPTSLLGPHLLVYDLVYNPARTALLAAAEAAGAQTLEGLPMLIYQGAASFERWTGRLAPIHIMMQHGRRALYQSKVQGPESKVEER
ncbi:MAG: shikimate dehydrogenase [Chloroflexi bacterium]|nr:shikimate dehydrogenase [Chloroflexota bacterium]